MKLTPNMIINKSITHEDGLSLNIVLLILKKMSYNHQVIQLDYIKLLKKL